MIKDNNLQYKTHTPGGGWKGVWGCEVFSHQEEAAAKFKQILSTRPFPHNFLSPVCFFCRINAEKQTAIFHNSVIHNTALVLFSLARLLIDDCSPAGGVCFFLQPPKQLKLAKFKWKSHRICVQTSKHLSRCADQRDEERQNNNRPGVSYSTLLHRGSDLTFKWKLLRSKLRSPHTASLLFCVKKDHFLSFETLVDLLQQWLMGILIYGLVDVLVSSPVLKPESGGDPVCPVCSLLCVVMALAIYYFLKK